ncbi:P-loop containing nucleoside triphosphate hydrolase protein [Dunaliella salina]|uniref:P-loop containing nucleoside triphosphate hydrolase protein n=1 Tax=Dunaliella salina TaxID=3046 RepID=A0ABQ7GXJ3_DUNSA|nr:P-loop containing nucleoside triphosphate hydrolase protein [Dunaliella salina]|eukprot:KAF5839331.1 P-loop containing nucleoside triphosphate hydrolase protein [Dunaliella salina]
MYAYFMHRNTRAQVLLAWHTLQVLGSWMTKIDALLRRLLLLREQAPDEKSLVFSQFPDALKLVGRALSVNGLGHVSLNRTRRRAKGSARDAVARFKNDPDVRVFLLSLQHGAAGLTLCRANHVFMIDVSLDPAIEQQAVARVHRIGQQQPVQVTRLLCHDTVEVAVLQSLEKKQQLWQEQQGGLSAGNLVEGEDEEDEQMELADDQVDMQGEEAIIPPYATPPRNSAACAHMDVEGHQATPGTSLLPQNVPNNSQGAPSTPASRRGRSESGRGRAVAGASAEAPALAVIAKQEKMEASEALDLLNALG